VVPIEVTKAGDELFLDFLGNKRPLIAFSNTSFSSEGNPITFVINDHGMVTHLVLQAAEGDLKAPRMESGR
jgi:hypothetical protein